MVFQNYALFRHLTVAQNVGFGLKVMKNGPGRAEIARRVEELLEMMPLRRREGSSLERSKEASIAVFLLLASLATQSAAARRPHES